MAVPGGDPSPPVTIAYIAESAGVSVPTVSTVLNGRSGVSADTRARVEELVNRYGYRRPAGSRRSNLVELVLRELESMWAVEIIRGVERVWSPLLSGVGVQPAHHEVVVFLRGQP
jgi:DNA-binding LacI/PurR family transcriptional regulator